MESINGFEGWDDLLGFNNGGWWADELSRWKLCLFKVQRGGKMFILENIQESQSFFFFSYFFFARRHEKQFLGLRPPEVAGQGVIN